MTASDDRRLDDSSPPATEVSVALCTYNGEAYLAEQLASIASQDRLPDELVVCDDRSTDATLSLVRQFAAETPFPVRLEINPQRLGSTENFARCVGLCRGRLILLADQDDVWMPHKVSRLCAALSAAATTAFVFSDADLIDEQGRPLGYRLWETLPFPPDEQAQFNSGRHFDLLLRRNLVTGTTMAFRAEYRELLLPIAASWVHDGWFALLLAAVGSAYAVAEPLVRYRQHGRQQIGARPETLLNKYRRRKRLGSAIYAATAANYAAALERLQSHAGRLQDRTALDALEKKVTHWRTRAWMRTDGPLRLPAIAKELLHGCYDRYSSGWRSAVEDILL